MSGPFAQQPSASALASPFAVGDFDPPGLWSRLTIDIETENGRPEEADVAMRLTWTPSWDWKDETIGKRLREARDKKLEKLALLETAPIGCVSLRSSSGDLMVLHSVAEEPARKFSESVPGHVEGFANERAMLLGLRLLTDRYVVPHETTIVGFNVKGFDLRRLRRGYVRNGLRLPPWLALTEQPVFDLMREFGSRFSSEDKLFIALADVLPFFGMESHKSTLSGAEVPGLFAKARSGDRSALDTIVGYSLLDAATEDELYLRMTGQVEDRG